MILRPYQLAAIDAVYNYFATHAGNPIIALPTGTGKSVVIAEFCRKVLITFPGQKIIIATHSKELIEQNHAKIVEHWPVAPAGIFSASVGRRDIAPITFVGIQTVAKNPGQFGHVDLLMIDECHLVGQSANAQYLKFIAGLKQVNPNLKTIGLTATPFRLGMGMLTEGGVFTDICYDLTERTAFNRLIAEGYIAPLTTRKTETELDVSGVGKSGGEFISTELQDAVDKSPITSAALTEACKYGVDRKSWLIFAAGLEHADHICEMLVLMGVPTAVVSGDLLKPERERILRDFKAGIYRAVVNMNVLTTGFDFPGIDLIVMLRPTSSPGLWVQMLGRGTRPAEGKKDCLVLDFAGNTKRLGPINDPIIPRKKGASGGGGQAPVRLCPVCNCYSHASARECEACGEIFPTSIKIQAASSQAQVIADDLPQIVEFKVTGVSFHRHDKPGRPPSLRVSYVCGLRRFDQWVCLEHTGYAQYKAAQWWNEHGSTPVPTTVDEALVRAPAELAQPKAIYVWTNCKHPEIMRYEF
jgi:DNA repair protein RadD